MAKFDLDGTFNDDYLYPIYPASPTSATRRKPRWGRRKNRTRTQLPKAIAILEKLISAAKTGNEVRSFRLRVPTTTTCSLQVTDALMTSIPQ